VRANPSILWAGSLAGALLFNQAALAYPVALLDEERLGPRLEQIDVDAHELWVERPTQRHAPVWIAIDAKYTKQSDGSRSVAGMLMLGLPLDRAPSIRVGGIAQTRGGADAEKPTLKPPPPPPRLHHEPGPVKIPTGVERPERLRVPSVITPLVARTAVRAALRRANLLDPGARLDALASRARTSAVLPELRLRVARIVDDGQSLMPTEYDPTRVTATGGTTLWLDARATWRLDRLLFADEEVAIERMRNDRADAQGKLVKHVLEVLFRWQKSVAQQENPTATPDEALAATLHMLEAEAELDLMTDGWFTRWRAEKARHVPTPPASSPSSAPPQSDQAERTR
jgi:hypothetical protein